MYAKETCKSSLEVDINGQQQMAFNRDYRILCTQGYQGENIIF